MAVSLTTWMTAPILTGQTLVEAAKKERERRAAYIGKEVVVVTSRSLSHFYSLPARTEAEAVSPRIETEQVRDEQTGFFSLPHKTDLGGSLKKEPSGPDDRMREGVGFEHQESEIQREAIWRQARDRADNLELKMNDLWNSYWSSRDKESRMQLEKEISALFEGYHSAREEEAGAWIRMERRKE